MRIVTFVNISTHSHQDVKVLLTGSWPETERLVKASLRGECALLSPVPVNRPRFSGAALVSVASSPRPLHKSHKRAFCDTGRNLLPENSSVCR